MTDRQFNSNKAAGAAQASSSQAGTAEAAADAHRRARIFLDALMSADSFDQHTLQV
jgi:hypothetical protein